MTSIYHYNIKGICFTNSSSKKIESKLTLRNKVLVDLELDNGDVREYNLSEIRIDSRIGNSMRHIFMPDGNNFQTMENDYIDEIAKMQKPESTTQGLLHLVESKGKYFAASLGIIILSAYLFVSYAVPLMAKTAAFAIPDSVMSEIDGDVRELMESDFFKKSSLSKRKKKRIQWLFRRIIKSEKAASGYSYKLYIRKGGMLGANAFALPDGSVIITDELIGLSKNSHEITAVLAHEVGHVVNRHGVRMVIQSSVLSLAIVLITGDVLSYASIIAALPEVLVRNGYSRDFEREADMFAYQYLKSKKINPVYFARIMRRMSKMYKGSDKTSLFSTHPGTEERVKIFERKE